MHLKLFALVSFLTLGLSPVALAADQSCCGKAAAGCADHTAMSGHQHANMACCKDGTCDMPCCQDKASDRACCKESHPLATSAIDFFIGINGLDVTLPSLDVPGRQTAVVWFHRPVWVGRNVLQGKFVIEHDTDRMARGEPCTHIYAADDTTTPVAAFHCTHIDAKRTAKNTVMLEALPDGMRRLVLFQFAGDVAAHGYPTGR